MNFDRKINTDDILIYCSNGLQEFANEFINYYSDNIDNIKKIFNISNNKKLIVALVDDPKMAPG